MAPSLSSNAHLGRTARRICQDEDDDEDDDYNNGDNDDEGESEDKAGAGDRSLDQNLGRAQDHDQKPGAAENRTGSAARVCYDLLSDLIAAAVASNKEMSQENAEALSAPIVNSAHNDESIGRPISIRSLIASEPDQVVHESLDGPSSVPSERHSDATAVNEQSDTRQYKNPVTNAMVKGDAVGIADLAAPKNTAGSDCDTETDPNGIQSDAPAATATGERVCASGSVELNHTTNESSEDTVSSQSTRVTPGAAVLRLVDQVWHEPSLEEEPQQLQQSLKRKAPPQ
ncbi:uncharacterized protein BJ171DRAFT_169596 [Polychytrium aggregatum]|uniref:uncharacterized protein n=1 Tax=Polychytrium aggregatum TaxID=110093 RepID=UPI0022FE74D3|nr:uncharacterized protein BJ171DRAFT_169596 [Polychytrium aggregatum]KAI9208859.1 hypothetical protein BJ171DRAFT_169596 [Polychytrium aggregatum]